MTLILTELSSAGIVMAADSAISFEDEKSGLIRKVNHQGWSKLLRVPHVKAAISYWGAIGRVTEKQFDLWLKEKVVDSRNYVDLPSLADHIAGVLNEACGNKPLDSRQDVGIHVSGYHPWNDGFSRPTFFHVHNGHGRLHIIHSWDEADGKRIVTGVFPEWQSEPRKLFEKHADFPATTNTVEQNLKVLDNSYRTRNGDYLIYAVIAQALDNAFNYINLIPNRSIPRDRNNLYARKAFIHKLLETIIWIYENSQQQPVVGGAVRSLALGADGYLLPLDKNIL